MLPEITLKSRELTRLEYSDDGTGLRVEVVDTAGVRVILRFRSFYGIRVADESDRQPFVSELVKADPGLHVLYEVTESEYLAWLHAESYGMREGLDDPVRHFVVVTSNDIVDVLSSREPDFQLDRVE